MSEIGNTELELGPKPLEKIEEMSKRLDVYHENLSDAELLDRVLDELGDEGTDDDESTFDEKVDRLEYILGELGEYPY